MNFKNAIKIFPALLLLPLAGAHALTNARHANTTTLLPDGNILVVGGVGGTGNTPVAAPNTVEIYRMNSASYVAGPDITTARSSHTATLMSDGRVLIAGGFAAGAPLQSAQIFNPLTLTWSAELAMQSPRGAHTATLLVRGPNAGKILICGGQTNVNPAAAGGITNTCELFTPGADTFAAATSMSSPRMGHTASIIGRGGKVFVAGGKAWDGAAWVYLPNTEIYNVLTAVWAPATALNSGRTDHTATVLTNGNVIISGGYNGDFRYSPSEAWYQAEVPVWTANSHGFMDSAEMFNPEGGRVPIVGVDYGVMDYRVHKHSAVLLPDGSHQMTGGYGNIVPSYYTGPSVFEPGSVLKLIRLNATTAAVDPVNSKLDFLVETDLSRKVSGRIVNGDMYMSNAPVGTAEIEQDNLEVNLNAPVRTILDNIPVGSLAGSKGGGFYSVLTATSPTGIASFEPEMVIAPGPALVKGANIQMTGDQAAIGGAETALVPGGSLTISVSFNVPKIYIGGVISGTATITSGACSEDGGWYRLTLTGGVAQIQHASGYTVREDPLDPTLGIVTLSNLVIQDPEGYVINSTDTIMLEADLNGPAYTGDDQNPNTRHNHQIVGEIVASVAATLEYTVDTVQVEELPYNHLASSMVIREMVFSDSLSFDPSASDWSFGQPSLIPLFGHTSLLTPAADNFLIGGRNCESGCARDTTIFTANNTDIRYVMHNDSKWPAARPLNTRRAFHTSTLLPDNSILTCGGSDGGVTLSSCELLNPVTNRWGTVGTMTTSRALHTATLLPNGNVLVTGGTSGSTDYSTASLNTAEIYYADTKRWLAVPPMSIARQNHTANILPDGNILVSGGSNETGYTATAELFNANSLAWETVGSMSAARSQHTSVNTKDGGALAIGGIGTFGALKTVERYDYIAKTWNGAGQPNPMNTARYAHTANLLRDGRVLVMGGSDNSGSLYTAEIFDGTNWNYTSNTMPSSRANHRSVLLPNGKILVTGGESSGQTNGDIAGYSVDISSWQGQGRMDARANHTTVLTANNVVINIGGWSGATYLESCDASYFSYIPDLQGVDPKERNPLISSATAMFDRPGMATIISSASNFHGFTEASGGGAGSANSSFSNPRVYLQAVDIQTGFLTDITTYLYTLYGGPNNNWETTVSSISILIPNVPGQFPYGWHHVRVANNGQFSPGYPVQISVPRPTGLPSIATGTVLNANSIRWTWTQDTLAGADGYAIFSSSDDFFISSAAFTPAVAFTQTGLAPNTEISIKVGGYNTGGYSGFQKSATYYTLAVPPASLTVNAATFETANLSWDTMGNSAITAYEFSFSAYSDFSSELVVIPFSNNYTSTYTTVNQLTPGQTYYFRVRARNGEGLITGYSNSASTITVGNLNGLTGTAISNSAINWAWGPAAGATYYEVYDVTQGPGDHIFLGSTTANSYDHTGLNTNASYSAGVIPVRDTGSGPVKGDMAYSGSLYTLAVQPLPLSITNISTSSFRLNWISNGNPDGTRYRVKYSRYADFSTYSTFTVTNTGIMISTLTPNVAYYAELLAYNEAGTPTVPISFTPIYTLAQPPTNLTPSVISMSGVTLVWNTWFNSPETLYEIRSTTVPGFTDNITMIRSFADKFTGNTISINGLFTGTTYYFDIAAMNGAFVQTSRAQCVPVAKTLAGPSGIIGAIGGTSDPARDVTIAGTLPNGTTVSLFVPAGAFASQTAIDISSSAANNCSQTAIPVVEVEINTQNGIQPLIPVTLTINYSANQAVTIDPNISRLTLGRYYERSGECLPLETRITQGTRSITSNLNHLSLFQLMVQTAASNLNSIRVFPNPFYANRNHGYVTIDNLPASAKIRIYTLSGDKVWEGTAASTGVLIWKGVNKSGFLVGSGVYLAVVDSSFGKKVLKIAVER